MNTSTGEDINKASLSTDDALIPGELPSDNNGAIILPGSLFGRVDKDDIGAFFGVYDNTNLFPVGVENRAEDGKNSTVLTQTGSYILTATVGKDGTAFEKLQEPVSVTLKLTVNETVSFFLVKFPSCRESSIVAYTSLLFPDQKGVSHGTLTSRTGHHKAVTLKSVKIDSWQLALVTTLLISAFLWYVKQPSSLESSL